MLHVEKNENGKFLVMDAESLEYLQDLSFLLSLVRKYIERKYDSEVADAFVLMAAKAAKEAFEEDE